MDRTVKILLAIIAFSLVSLNLQLAGVELVKEANAKVQSSDFVGIKDALNNIADAIRHHE